MALLTFTNAACEWRTRKGTTSVWYFQNKRQSSVKIRGKNIKRLKMHILCELNIRIQRNILLSNPFTFTNVSLEQHAGFIICKDDISWGCVRLFPSRWHKGYKNVITNNNNLNLRAIILTLWVMSYFKEKCDKSIMCPISTNFLFWFLAKPVIIILNSRGIKDYLPAVYYYLRTTSNHNALI